MDPPGRGGVHGNKSGCTLSRPPQAALFTVRIHHSPPALRLRTQLTAVNQVIKPVNALPRRLHVINRKIIETNQDFLPVLSLMSRENQSDISSKEDGGHKGTGSARRFAGQSWSLYWKWGGRSGSQGRTRRLIDRCLLSSCIGLTVSKGRSMDRPLVASGLSPDPPPPPPCFP